MASRRGRHGLAVLTSVLPVMSDGRPKRRPRQRGTGLPFALALPVVQDPLSTSSFECRPQYGDGLVTRSPHAGARIRGCRSADLQAIVGTALPLVSASPEM
jgi:hypothetical protein